MAGFKLGHTSECGPIAVLLDLERVEPVARWRHRRLQKRAAQGWRRRVGAAESCRPEEDAVGQATGERFVRRELKGVLQ